MRHRILSLLALSGLVLAGPAYADPRGDALAGIARCGAAADDRAWLDCVYGAVQPVRGKLGLPPAPQARNAFPPPGPAVAALPPVPPAPAPRRKQGWLSGMLHGDGGAAVPEPEFGMPKTKPDSLPANINRVQARMASYETDRFGIFTVTLANGQVWKQVDGDTTVPHWKKPASSYVALVTRGSLGSYDLQVQGEPGTFKVRRSK